MRAIAYSQPLEVGEAFAALKAAASTMAALKYRQVIVK
jgi:hypothetical protein